MRLSLLVVPVYGAIFCFAAAMIMHIKSQRSLPKRQKPDRERRQFLEVHLKSYGTPFTVKTYFALGFPYGGWNQKDHAYYPCGGPGAATVKAAGYFCVSGWKVPGDRIHTEKTAGKDEKQQGYCR